VECPLYQPGQPLERVGEEPRAVRRVGGRELQRPDRSGVVLHGTSLAGRQPALVLRVDLDIV
jgi:hypothetical protein